MPYKDQEKRRVYAKEYRKKNKEILKVKRDTIENRIKRKEYNKIPRVILRKKKHDKKRESIIRARKYREKNKKRIKEKARVYHKKNRVRTCERDKLRRREDKSYNTKIKIKSRFNKIMRLYFKSGKVASSKKYGVDYGKIIKYLKPFPKDIENYHIDHIIPLGWFDLENSDEIKWAWAPENLQWLRKEINLWKSDRFILPLNMKEQKRLII